MKNETQQCPEFPFFGATYPDATCINGYLWDLDKCDDNGNLYATDDNPPCPFCNQQEFIERHLDDYAEQIQLDSWDDVQDKSSISYEVAKAQARAQIIELLKKHHEKYDYNPSPNL